MAEVSVESFCSQAAGVLQIVGYVLTVFKIAIPLLIIAYGIFDLGKVVTTGKDDDMKKQIKVLLYRVIAGVVIFFIPTIVMLIFGWVNEYKKTADPNGNDDFKVCRECVLHPWAKDCKDNIKG